MDSPPYSPSIMTPRSDTDEDHDTQHSDADPVLLEQLLDNVAQSQRIVDDLENNLNKSMEWVKQRQDLAEQRLQALLRDMAGLTRDMRARKKEARGTNARRPDDITRRWDAIARRSDDILARRLDPIALAREMNVLARDMDAMREADVMARRERGAFARRVIRQPHPFGLDLACLLAVTIPFVILGYYCTAPKK